MAITIIHNYNLTTLKFNYIANKIVRHKVRQAFEMDSVSGQLTLKPTVYIATEEI